MIEAKRWHVNQDEHGFWFTVEEDIDGGLHLFTHAADKAHAIHDAEQANRDNGWDAPILVEPDATPYPDGGIVEEYEPPKSRKSGRGARILRP